MPQPGAPGVAQRPSEAADELDPRALAQLKDLGLGGAVGQHRERQNPALHFTAETRVGGCRRLIGALRARLVLFESAARLESAVGPRA